MTTSDDRLQLFFGNVLTAEFLLFFIHLHEEIDFHIKARYGLVNETECSFLAIFTGRINYECSKLLN